MTPVLLDTNVLSELVRPSPDLRVTAFVADVAAASARGRPTDPVDALIAASALVRGATVATRNVRDFAPLGVDVVDPWAGR